MMHNMIRTQISLTEDQWNLLRLLGTERRTSMSALIRDAVDKTYAQPRQDLTYLRSLLNKYSSGIPSDASSPTLDDDIADAFGA